RRLRPGAGGQQGRIGRQLTRDRLHVRRGRAVGGGVGGARIVNRQRPSARQRRQRGGAAAARGAGNRRDHAARLGPRSGPGRRRHGIDLRRLDAEQRVVLFLVGGVAAQGAGQ